MRKSLVTWLVLLVASGCAADFVAVEVLPPRSGTCSAPAIKAQALGRGLLDLDASRERNGAYLADLRIASPRDRVIDGVGLAYVLPENASSSSKSVADDLSADPPLGDVVLDAKDDDELRRAIVEDVVLVPRDLAIALRDDEEVVADSTEFATIVVELTAASTLDVEGETRAPSTFAVDVCRGCLVARPTDEECPDGVVQRDVCRPGQEDDLFACAVIP